MADEIINPLSMSDEDFAKLPAIAPVVDLPKDDDAPIDPLNQPVEGADENAGGGEPKPNEGEPTELTPEEVAAAAAAEGGAQGNADGEGEPTPEAPKAPTPPTAEELNAFYAEMTAPIKAVGKELDIRSPSELRRLVQLGANYGRRMQELAPSRKAVAMLDQAGLLGDPEKLGLAIAAVSGDKAAIQKLLADQTIDPLDLDVERAADYKPGAYEVSDLDVQFGEAVNEVSSLEFGKELLAEIDETWDEASKATIYKHPGTLEQLRAAREDGSYSQIMSEVERLRVLSQIPAHMSTLDAYVHAGQGLASRGLLGKPAEPTTANPVPAQPAPAAQVLGHRVAAPAKPALNTDRAKGTGSPSKGTAVKAPPINPLAMTDEEYKKHFGNLPI